MGACRWAESLAANPVWSPLFLIFYGSLRRLLADPFTTTTVLRLALVASLTGVVLAVLRSLASIAQIETERVGWVYVDETAWNQPDWRAVLGRLGTSRSWRRLAPADASASWALLHRKRSPLRPPGESR